ncbi:MAG: hypothetical protein EBT80_02960 [Chitinophagales bacterium]|nr:hypothetical protein [Chitinophagales bacterium]
MKFALSKACKFNDLRAIFQDNKGVVKIDREGPAQRVGLANSLTFALPMTLYRYFSFIAAFSLIHLHGSAQILTGIWKGYFVTKDQSQYKIEMQVKESKGQLTGVTYSYLNTEYYGKATLTGRVNKKEGNISIQEIKTVEVRSGEGSVNCLMNYTLSYSQSGKEEYLEGNFTSKYETDSKDVKKGGDCGGGIVFLRRVTSSDFENESFLKSNAPAAKKIFYNEAPQTKKQGPSTSLPVQQKPVTKTASTPRKPTTAVTAKQITENKPKPVSTASNKESSEKIEKPATATPAVVKHMPSPVENNRQNELLKEINISAKQISISVYDNGEIDGDTVSVYLNGQVILSKKRLGTTPLLLKVTLDENQDVQELTFVAESLGRIPPNSALMIVDAGQQQYRLQVLSSDKKNAVFRFIYRPSR